MKNGLYLAMAVILCTVFAFTLRSTSRGARTSVVTRNTASAEVPRTESAAQPQADCHDGDILIDEGPLSYVMLRKGKAVTRVTVLAGTQTATTILPSSVHISEPLEDEPEYLHYDACDKSVRIVVKQLGDSTRVRYE